jgi:hypothetical protein
MTHVQQGIVLNKIIIIQNRKRNKTLNMHKLFFFYFLNILVGTQYMNSFQNHINGNIRSYLKWRIELSIMQMLIIVKLYTSNQANKSKEIPSTFLLHNSAIKSLLW